MKNITKKMTMGAIAAGVAVTAFSATASANDSESGTTEATITGGSLSIDNLSVNGFDATTLDGTEQTVTTSIDEYNVVDATGSGSGWDLNVNATEFSNENDSLPANSLNLSGHTVTSGDGSSSSDTFEPASGDIDTDDETGVNILSAGEDEGMGTFTVSGTELSLDLQPKDVKAGTYSSTVTFSLSNGPST